MPTNAINDTGVKYIYDKLDAKKVEKEPGKGLSTNDYDNTDKAKVDMIDNTTTSATGNPISIADLKSAQIALNPVITFEPIQAGSGTPSPSNVRAISGYDKIEVLSGGVNLLDKSKAVANERYNDTGTVSYTGSSRSVPIRIKPSTTYYFKNVYGTSQMQPIWWLDANKKYISYTNVGAGHMASGTAASPSNAYYVGVNFPSTNLDTVLVSEGQAIDYVDYHKTTDLSESLGQTVYGGSYDVRTGEFTVTHGIMDLGSIKGYYDDANHVFICNNTTILAQAKGSSTPISTYYEGKSPANNNSTAYSKGNNTLCFRWSTFDRFYIRDDAYTDITTLQTALTGQKLVYELATPIKIQLTPHEIALSQGYNYISTNGTSISLDYHNGELATHADVEQVAETVNGLGTNLLNVVEDVTSKFVLDSTNVYTSTMQVLKIGKMVFINGIIRPQALTSLQNKKLFDITDNRLLPLVGASANITANFVPVETAQSTTLPLITIVNSSYSQLRTSNNGAYGGITNITTSSLIIFSGAYVCKG